MLREGRGGDLSFPHPLTHDSRLLFLLWPLPSLCIFEKKKSNTVYDRPSDFSATLENSLASSLPLTHPSVLASSSCPRKAFEVLSGSRKLAIHRLFRLVLNLGVGCYRNILYLSSSNCNLVYLTKVFNQKDHTTVLALLCESSAVEIHVSVVTWSVNKPILIARQIY